LIYAIRVARGPIKFGLAEDPVARMGSLQIGNPKDLILLASCQTANDAAVEAEIHKHCRADHIRGEWFEASERTWKVAAHIKAGSIEDYLGQHRPKAATDLGFKRARVKAFEVVSHFLRRHAGVAEAI
jgi:hypothetical protein